MMYAWCIVARIGSRANLVSERRTRVGDEPKQHVPATPRVSLKSPLTDQSNDDLARDMVPQTKWHMFNLPQLIKVYLTL